MIPRDIQDDAARWSQGPLKDSVAHFPERSNSFTTASGLPVERLYMPDEESVDRYRDRLGFPGMYPFTHGASDHVPRPALDDAEYAGYSTPRKLTDAIDISGPGLDRALHRIRPAHANWPRLGPSSLCR